MLQFSGKTKRKVFSSPLFFAESILVILSENILPRQSIATRKILDMSD